MYTFVRKMPTSADLHIDICHRKPHILGEYHVDQTASIQKSRVSLDLAKQFTSYGKGGICGLAPTVPYWHLQ